MTNKEIAERLRELAASPACSQFADLKGLADTLDPPRPEPGTVVWWRRKEGLRNWCSGYVSDQKLGVVPLSGEEFDDYYVPFDRIEWKPARILAPDEVAVTRALFSSWLGMCHGVDWNNGTHAGIFRKDVERMTLAEAERMEATDAIDRYVARAKLEDDIDPGEEALSDVLQGRIQAALDYIDVMWPRMPTDLSAHIADLANLTAALEGNQEADQ